MLTPEQIAQEVNTQALETETTKVDVLMAKIEESIVPQGVEIPKPDPIFSLSGIPVMTKKSLSLLKGQAKAGKTTVTAWITSNIIKDGINVAWFDTEQGLYYASRTQHWVLSIAGLEKSDNLVTYDLKIFKPSERVEVIARVIEDTTPDLIIIDGVRDLIYDINSPEESTLIATELMKWAEKFDCHILNIIHENKGSSHARGHLGTEMSNKAELVMKVFKDDQGQTVCEPEFCRGEPFEPFAFERDGYGRPVLVSYQHEIKTGESNKKGVKPSDIGHDTHIEILSKVFKEEKEWSYSDLQIELRRVYMDYGVDSMGIGKAKDFISWYAAEKYLGRRKDGSKTIYFMEEKDGASFVPSPSVSRFDNSDEPPF